MNWSKMLKLYNPKRVEWKFKPEPLKKNSLLMFPMHFNIEMNHSKRIVIPHTTKVVTNHPKQNIGRDSDFLSQFG